MVILTLDLPEGVEPCPHGCGRTTEDPYGGPCRCCWDQLDAVFNWLRPTPDATEELSP